MKSFTKALIVIAVLAALVYFVAIPYLHTETKKFSPTKSATLAFGDGKIEVDYSSPSKKGRVIFGELVPYGEVWRTGANEPTTFSTSKDIKIIDKTLPSGTYSLWTIPNKASWKVIFNTEIPDWGVTRVNGNKTTHEALYDYLVVDVPVTPLEMPVEDFSIWFENEEDGRFTQEYLSLAWDTEKISVPISK
ncbi:MAG: DUF2911 domain-containing protein [Maribacter sp.]